MDRSCDLPIILHLLIFQCVEAEESDQECIRTREYVLIIGELNAEEEVELLGGEGFEDEGVIGREEEEAAALSTGTHHTQRAGKGRREVTV